MTVEFPISDMRYWVQANVVFDRGGADEPPSYSVEDVSLWSLNSQGCFHVREPLDSVDFENLCEIAIKEYKRIVNDRCP